MDRRETERVLAAIRQARTSGARAALATVVRVAGSAYRREGATMLVREDGSYVCMLSGGCLEPAIVQRAREVIATGEPALATHHLDDDTVWGLGIGCGGAVDIRIERLESDPLTRRWLEALDGAAAAVRVTPLAGAGGRLIVFRDGSVDGNLDDPAVEADAIRRALERLDARHPHSGTERLGDAELFFEVSTPPPELVVFGAGHDTIPVVQRAREVGFAVSVVDVRSAYLTTDRYPGARLVLAETGRMADQVSIPAGAFVLVMNHHLARDRETLALALASQADYIGVLGPRTRFERLLASEGRQAPAPAADGRVFTPVGLDLGAETPEEVALAIVAELLAVQRGFGGGPLRDRPGSVHDAEAARATARS